MNDETFDEWFERTGLKARAIAHAEARGEARLLNLLRSGKSSEEILRQYDTQTATTRASTT
jgi:DNA-binding CsgD family transcriptional regulator